MRSLVSVIRLRHAQQVFMQDMSFFDALLDLMVHTEDIEVAANALKVVRLILKQSMYRAFVSHQSPSAIN